MQNRNRESTQKQRGVALAISLIMLFLLSAIGAALIFATQTEMWSSLNYRLLTQSRYVAEAGAQQAVNWIQYNYTSPTNANIGNFDMTKTPVQYNNAPVMLSAMSGVASNYPDNTVQSAFNTALNGKAVPGLSNTTYSVTAELLSMRVVTGGFASPGTQYLQTWQITSQGTITGTKNATTQVIETIDKTGTPLFVYAAFANSAGCAAINFSGGVVTDSYNSSQGSYASTQQNTNGNIGTNGNVTMSGGATTVHGTESAPNTNTGACPAALTAGGGASVSGGLVALTTPPSYPTPAAPSPTPPTTNQNIAANCGGLSGCTNLSANQVSLSPGQYGNLNVAGGTSVTLSAGTYNINSLVLSGGSPLLVGSGPVVLNIAGTSVPTAINLSGGSITNITGVPANLQIVYGGSGGIILSGSSGSSAVVYAPNAPVTMSGSSGWYGAIIGTTITDSGGAAIHYDSALQNNFFTVGNFNPTAFTWSKN